MERNHRKRWFLLGFSLFFLIFISFAVPANEIFEKFDSLHNHSITELETLDQLNGGSHLNKTNTNGDPTDDNSTTLADGEDFNHRQNKRPGRLLPLQLL